MKYAVITQECEIILKEKVPTITDELESFLNSLYLIYEKVKRDYDLSGIALSMAGMIDSRQGFMYTGGNVKCITDLNIVEIMERRCGIPVTVENDAKCAALAELWKGALLDCQNAVAMICGTGIGGAIIQDRKVLTGAHFMAGEFSYVMTETKGEYELKNCVAENTGMNALIEYVAEETGISAKKLDGEKIFVMANRSEEKVLKGLRRFVQKVAIQIHNYQYILDPEKIAIGGGVSIQPLFIQMIKEELYKINRIYPWTLPIPEVVTCKFFNDANLIGAVYVHLQLSKCTNIEKE